MREYRITEINKFMALLLKSESFDDYLLKEALIRTFMDFRFDGTLHKDFFDTDEWEDRTSKRFAKWKDVKSTALELIRGKHTPLAMEFKLIAPEETGLLLIEKNGIKTLPQETVMLNLNISFKDGIAKAVTGLYRSGFSLDRELDRLWDESVGELLKKYDVL
ncbi:MAG: hypothetical protein J6Z46_05835 [Lachnospiraceae bacterium]|nr:hypothetical protein [Lachnospiraceae bacterium]